ncbi:hypothetical protein ABW19_dt0204650 [Dactylella cylindrospora]|nr:hypothetical protein ABW19_dt0204650 [Dactylella cylindrospora]
MDKQRKRGTVNHDRALSDSTASASSENVPPNDPSKQPFAWRRLFFESNEFKKLQDDKVKDLFNIADHENPHPPRHDMSKTHPSSAETRDWYDFHFPTGIVLFPYNISTISNNLAVKSKGGMPPPPARTISTKKKGGLNGISISNYRRIQDLRRGDRIILPDDPEIATVNKGIIPKGVLIVNRIGLQEGSNYHALQVRTFTQLLIYEFVLPPHIRALHLVETETCLMNKISSNIPLPGYFILQHAYLLDMEVEYTPTEEEIQNKTKAPLYAFECAFLSPTGAVTKQKFIAAETIYSAVNRLHVSWHVGKPSREADFVKSNKWILWLLKYAPSTTSSQARRREEHWPEAETYQVLGWSTSGVMATGTESLGALQITELLAPFKVFEEDMFRLLAVKRGK